MLAHTEKHDLYEEITRPILVGKFVLSHTQTLPGYTSLVSLILLDLDSFSMYWYLRGEPFKDSHCCMP